MEQDAEVRGSASINPNIVVNSGTTDITLCMGYFLHRSISIGSALDSMQLLCTAFAYLAAMMYLCAVK
jgi:hypothetical protein